MSTATRLPAPVGVAGRFVGTARRELLVHVVVLNAKPLQRLLAEFAGDYNGQRPRAGPAGATPDEIYFGWMPAHHHPRFEPRARWLRSSRCARPQAPVRGRPGVRLDLEMRFLDGRSQLPVVSLSREACGVERSAPCRPKPPSARAWLLRGARRRFPPR